MIRLDPKRPDETRRLAHDWSAFLGDDTIASQTTTSSGVTIGADAPSSDGKAVEFEISGGDDGAVAVITQSIITAAGDHESETFTIVVRVADEPVSVSEAKAQLGVTDDSDDATISGLITAAREWVERYTGLILVQRQFTERRVPKNGAIRLFKGPLVTVDGVSYGDSQTYVPRFWAPDREILAIAGGRWPTLACGDQFAITYTAGFAAGKVPQPLCQAIILLVRHWFDDPTSADIPPSAVTLCGPYRVLTL